MKSKKRSICILVVLLLAFIANSVFSWTPRTVLAQGEETITIADEKLREQVLNSLKSLNNNGALVEGDKTTEQLKINFDRLTRLELKLSGIDMENAANVDVLKKLINSSDNLKDVVINNSRGLGSFDFSILNNRTSMQSLCLYNCGLTSVPDLTMPNLTSLNLSGNELAAQDACAKIDKAHFPRLAKLYLDDCSISDVSFLQNLGEGVLETLRLGRNELTDESLDTLAGMKDTALSNLTTLRLGKEVFTGTSTSISGSYNSNKFTAAKLASLPVAFPNLKTLDLSGCRLTSLSEFVGLKDRDIEIDFKDNKISDYAGLEGKTSFNVKSQEFTIADVFVVKGEASEMPELLKRIADPSDALYGTIKPINGVTVDTAAKTILVSEDFELSVAEVEVTSGWLGDSIYRTAIYFMVKEKPSYTVPTGLTATVGQTLSAVALPEGFTWKDASSDVGTVGEHTFKAVYTPKNLDKYVVVDDIDVKVTVQAQGHVHSWNDAEWKSDAANHWHVCTTCEEKKDVAAHSFGGWITDTEATESETGTKHRVCSACGYTENGSIPVTGHEHQFSAEWEKNETGHWHVCACGEKTEVQAHSYGEWITDTEATESETGTKHRVCSACDYTENGIIPVIGHEHQFSAEWEKNETGHWHVCACGEKTEVQAHSYGEWITDTEATESAEGTKHRVCGACGYEEKGTIPAKGHEHQFSSAWEKNETSHWHACACGEKSEIQAHGYGEWITDTEATESAEGTRHRVCSACGYEEKGTIPVKGHEHQFSTAWEKNETNHWHVCTCGEKSDIQEHSYGEWIIDKEATESETGTKHRICGVCNYTEEQTIAATGIKKPNEGGDKIEDDKEKDKVPATGTPAPAAESSNPASAKTEQPQGKNPANPDNTKRVAPATKDSAPVGMYAAFVVAAGSVCLLLYAASRRKGLNGKSE